MSEKVDPAAGPISAEQLRMSILQKEMEKMDVERKAREAEEKKLAAFTQTSCTSTSARTRSRW